MRPRRAGLQARRSLLTLLVLTAVACAPAATAPPMNQTGPQTLPKPVTPPLPPAVSPLVTSMLTGLADYMVSVYAENRDLIPNNPGLATWIRAKMAMLESPTLINDIFSGRRWIDGEAPTAPGGPTPIAAVFALESMREECADVVRIVERHLPVLAEFFDERFPTGAMKIWYGFKTGATGGGGAMYLVDRGTQDQFRLPSSLSYEAMLAHEAAHSYIGNEALTQFLEVYTYNVARGAGVDHHGWTELRGWTPDTPSVFGVTYVLDVYHRVGFDVMRRGFRAIRPLRPGYGMPLSPFVIAAFLNEVPEEHRAFVQERLSRIIA